MAAGDHQLASRPVDNNKNNCKEPRGVASATSDQPMSMKSIGSKHSEVVLQLGIETSLREEVPFARESST